MLDERWRLWVNTYESGGEICADPFGEGRWAVVCNLPPGHKLPHEHRKGYGTVVHATWPWEPANNPVPGYFRYTTHRPNLPAWTCGICGLPWPCGQARSDLRHAADTNPDEHEHIRRSLEEAQASATHLEPGERLDQRFTAWLPTPPQ